MKQECHLPTKDRNIWIGAIMGYRNIMISNGLELNIKDSQLLVGQLASIPLEDINSILIESQSVRLSSYLLQKAMGYGIVIYCCDEKHIPNTVVLPLQHHHRHFKMLKMQMETSKPLQKRLWQQIIVQKIHNQARCLEYMNMKGYKELDAMKRQVKSGDSTYVEGRAAAFYFRHLFGDHFSRGEEHIINAALNYGYAIIRGMIARTIICYGFEPSLGIWHHSELNGFNLADDFIEPFRPVVDLYVSGKFDYSESSKVLTPQIKKGLFSVLNYDMNFNGEKQILGNSIEKMIMSFGGALMGKRDEMQLPELIPLQEHRYE